MKHQILLVFLLLVLSRCNNKADKKSGKTDTTELHNIIDSTKKSIDSTLNVSGVNPGEADHLTALAKLIVQDLKNKNFKAIAAHVCDRGLSFSANGYIDPDDINFRPDEVITLWEDTKKYTFPSFDVEDNPKRTFRDYYKGNVYDKDFVSAANVVINDVKRGPVASILNVQDVYPHAVHFDFFIPAPKESELDWATLKIIFVKEKGVWCLRHIVHDNWTP